MSSASASRCYGPRLPRAAPRLTRPAIATGTLTPTTLQPLQIIVTQAAAASTLHRTGSGVERNTHVESSALATASSPHLHHVTASILAGRTLLLTLPFARHSATRSVSSEPRCRLVLSFCASSLRQANRSRIG